jgi:hypothetical protein
VVAVTSLQHFTRRLGAWCDRQKITVSVTYGSDIFSLTGYRVNC